MMASWSGSWQRMGGGRRWCVTGLGAAVLALAIFLVSTAGEWPGSWPDDLEPWKNPKLDVLVQTGLWWGGVVALALLVMLLATAPFWLQELPDGNSRPAELPRVRVLTFWLPVIAAMVAAGAFTWPRLDVSANGDELYNLRRYIMGSFQLDADKRPVLKATDWQDALFENRGADNHIPFTVASKASLGVWRALSGNDARHFHEVAMRLPAWVAGLLGVAALAICLWVAGYPSAGVVAAWLAALHPWYLRYATEASGYILLGLWVPLVCAAGVLALRTGRWGWWLAVSAGLFAMLASVLSAGAVGLLVVVVLAGVILADARRAGLLPMQVRRLLVALAMVVAGLALLLGPSVYQIARYLVVDRVDQVMGARWLADAWGHLAVGMPWHGKGFENDLILTVESLAAEGAALPWLAAGALGVAVLAGGVRLLASGRRETLVLAIPLLLAGPAFYGAAEALRSYLLPRYVFFALPGVLVLAALGVEWLAASLRRNLPVAVAWVPVVAAVFLFGVATNAQRGVLMTHAKEDLKAVSEAIHGAADPLAVPSDEVLRGHVWSSISHYDPWSRNTVSDVELRALMQESLDRGVPMYFSFGYRDRAMTEAPVRAAVEMAENPLLFEHVGTFPGLEQDQFTHRLFKFRGVEAARHLER